MAYSTEDQLRTILVGRRSEDRGENANELDDDQLGFAIKDADAQIDMALKRRYKLPLQEPIPDIIHVLSMNIAAYLATLTFRGTTVMSADDPATVRYERARRILADIQRGQVDLDALENVTDESGQSVFNLLDEPLFPTHPWFGEEFAEGVIPPDRLYPRTF